MEKRQRAMTWNVSGASSRSSLTRTALQRSSTISMRRFLTRGSCVASTCRARGRPTGLPRCPHESSGPVSYEL
eukprot:scaffold17747_cov92-Phaeocystis_antarctica.AAC.5